MPQCFCPLCEQPGCRMVNTQSGAAAIHYECPTHCGTFRMGSEFLQYVWPTVTDDDKRAVAAYLQSTNSPPRAAPLIRGDNYREYLLHGRALQRTAAGRAPALAP